MIVFCEAAESEATRFVEPAFSFVDAASAIETDGTASSSTMVNCPRTSLMTAFDGEDKVTEKTSLTSSTVSARIGILNVSDVSPGMNVKVPVVAV